MERVHVLHPHRFLGRESAALEIGPGEGVGGVVDVHREGGEAIVLGIQEGIHPVVFEKHGVEGLAVHGVGAADGDGPSGFVLPERIRPAGFYRGGGRGFGEQAKSCSGVPALQLGFVSLRHDSAPAVRGNLEPIGGRLDRRLGGASRHGGAICLGARSALGFGPASRLRHRGLRELEVLGRWPRGDGDSHLLRVVSWKLTCRNAVPGHVSDDEWPVESDIPQRGAATINGRR
jgi:hypothetical protein